MSSMEKKYWIISVAYCVLLTVSVFANPNGPAGGVAWYGLFQMFGPTLGTILLSGGTLILMTRRKISVVNGVVAIVFLVVVSLVCLAFTIPVMMHV